MPTLHYTTGDATAPTGAGPRVICHICNDVGGWGRGFVTAISRRWPQPEADYRAWYAGRANNDFALGRIRLIEVAPGLHVANMIAQSGLRATAAGPPIRYEALAACLRQLSAECQRLRAGVHMPRIGAGLAGGHWPTIEQIIRDELVARGIEATVYDLP